MTGDKREDGGPAFPQPDLSAYGIGPYEGPGSLGGMSLRDYVIATLESLRTFNSDSDLDAYMVETIASLRGIRDSLEG